MKLMILNGPNMNLLGIREPEYYGKETYQELIRKIEAHAEKSGVSVECIQSNHEGTLIDEIERAYFEHFDGIVINPAGYTHTSIAIADALKAVQLPAVEVHVSEVDKREEYRKVSYVREAVQKTISGHGTQGYLEAIDFLVNELKK